MTTIRTALGISAAAAALIFVGCGSDSSPDRTDPALKSSAAVTNETGGDVLSLIGMLVDGGLPGPLAAVKSAADAKLAALKDNQYKGSYTDTYDCDEGSYTYAYSYDYTSKDDGSYSDNYTSKYTYNDCVYEGNWDYFGDPGTYNRRTQNGTRSYEGSYSYDAGTSSYTSSYSGSDNYTETYDNNMTETSESRVNHSTLNADYESTESGSMLMAPAAGSYESNGYLNGLYEQTITDESGTVVDGYKDQYAKLKGEMTEEYNEGVYTSSMTADGSWNHYDRNASGDTLTEGLYFNNLVYTGMEVGNENNETVNGTVGSTCMGGAVTLATTETIQMNDQAYTNACDESVGSSNTLPYSGTVTIKGDGMATALFDNNTTHSYLTVFSDANETNSTFDCWEEATAGSTCSSLD